MDQNQSELTLDESVAQVMQTLPPPIRSYLARGEYSVVTANLITKYGLHVDQGGVLEREIMLLLMGIESPEEFTQALTEEAQLSPQTISSIMQDVNTQIFVPLRGQLRRQTGSEPRPQASGMESGRGNVPQPPNPLLPPQAPLQAKPAPRPMNMNMPRPSYYVPPLQSPKYAPRVENEVMVRSIQQGPLNTGRQPTPPAIPVQPMQRPPMQMQQPMQQPPAAIRPPASTIAPLPPKIVMPSIATTDSQQPTENYESGGSQASINLIRPAEALSTETPLKQALRTVLPPNNLPGAMPESDIIPPTPKAPPVQYSSDPYRESVE